MRILYIAPGFGLDIQTGGGQRTTLVYEALRSFGEVDVMPVGYRAGPFHREVFPDAGTIHDGVFGTERLLGLLPLIGRFSPRAVQLISRHAMSRRRHFTPDDIARQTVSKVDLGGYDLIVGRYLEPVSKMGFLDGIDDVPVLIDIDDRDDTKMLNKARNPNTSAIKRFYAGRLHRELQGIFAEKIKLADHIWLASREDMEGINHPSKSVLPNIPFLTISDAYDARAAEQPGRIMFLGHSAHLPNCEGLQAFVSGAWPRIRQNAPNARLRVIGQKWTEALAGGTPAEGVEVPGFVENLEDEYATASIVISPVMEGGGTKIKVLEAMQFQKPVVAHRHSAHGFHSADGRVILASCDTMTEMADACLHLMNDEPERQALAAAGEAYVLANHSREMFSRRVREDCKAVLAQEGRATS